jgi:hypothetical protein
VGSSAFIANDADILQAHKRLEDLTRVDKDEGASCFLAHTTSLKRLRLILGDFGPSETPLRSEDPSMTHFTRTFVVGLARIELATSALSVRPKATIWQTPDGAQRSDLRRWVVRKVSDDS